MILNSRQVRMIDRAVLEELLQGRDIANDDRAFARAFLSHLIDRVNQSDGVVMAVPLARRLIGSPGWRDHMTVEEVHAFCIERQKVVAALEAIPRTATCDPEAEYMIGAAITLATRLGMMVPNFLS